MAVEIAHDARRRVAVMYCNTSDTAFGPIFTGPGAAEDAEAFLDWLQARGPMLVATMTGPQLAVFRHAVGDGTDPRDYTPDGLQYVHAKWVAESGVLA